MHDGGSEDRQLLVVQEYKSGSTFNHLQLSTASNAHISNLFTQKR
jgi:hypothetical protein